MSCFGVDFFVIESFITVLLELDLDCAVFVNVDDGAAVDAVDDDDDDKNGTILLTL